MNGPVAVHKHTGTTYARVNDIEPDSEYIHVSQTMVRETGWRIKLRANVIIWRPEAVECTPIKHRAPRRRAEPKATITNHVMPHTAQRQQIDLIVKAHTTVSTFLNYEEFLDELMEIVT